MRRLFWLTFLFRRHFLGHGFGIIPAPCTFSASAFPVPPSTSFGSLPECSRSSWEQYPLRPWVPQGNGAKKEKQNVPQSRSTHRLPRERSGETASPRQRCELHRAFRRYATVVERLERRVAVQNRVAPRRGFQPP